MELHGVNKIWNRFSSSHTQRGRKKSKTHRCRVLLAHTCPDYRISWCKIRYPRVPWGSPRPGVPSDTGPGSSGGSSGARPPQHSALPPPPTQHSPNNKRLPNTKTHASTCQSKHKNTIHVSFLSQRKMRRCDDRGVSTDSERSERIRDVASSGHASLPPSRTHSLSDVRRRSRGIDWKRTWNFSLPWSTLFSIFFSYANCHMQFKNL